MPNSRTERYNSLSQPDHDDMVEAMETISRAGEAAGKLAATFQWQRLTSGELQMQGVLRSVMAAGWTARDVLDMMEENDGP